MSVRNFDSVENVVSNLTKGTFGITMVAVTIPRMPQKRRSGEENRFYGKVHKCVMVTNTAIGYDYENNVNLKLKKKGLEPDFKAEKPKGKHWLTRNLILASDKDESQHYLRVTFRESSKTKVVWLVDGVPCYDSRTIEEINKWISSSSSSKKQADKGLTDSDEQVYVRDYKVDGIISISQGEKIYNKLNNVFSVEQIKTFFK